jgi:hypothetical protein
MAPKKSDVRGKGPFSRTGTFRLPVPEDPWTIFCLDVVMLGEILDLASSRQVSEMYDE